MTETRSVEIKVLKDPPLIFYPICVYYPQKHCILLIKTYRDRDNTWIYRYDLKTNDYSPFMKYLPDINGCITATIDIEKEQLFLLECVNVKTTVITQSMILNLKTKQIVKKIDDVRQRRWRKNTYNHALYLPSPINKVYAISPEILVITAKKIEIKDNKVMKYDRETNQFINMKQLPIHASKIKSIYISSLNELLLFGIGYSQFPGYKNSIEDIWSCDFNNENEWKVMNWKMPRKYDWYDIVNIYDTIIIAVYSEFVEIWILDLLNEHNEWILCDKTLPSIYEGHSCMLTINTNIHLFGITEDDDDEGEEEKLLKQSKHFMISIKNVLPKGIYNKYRLRYLDLVNGYIKYESQILVPIVLIRLVLVYYCHFK